MLLLMKLFFMNIYVGGNYQKRKKLIVFQKLSLIKRALLTGHKSFALSKMADFEIFRTYPKEYIQSAIALVIPKKIFDIIRKAKHN